MTSNDNGTQARDEQSDDRPVRRRGEVASMFGVTERTVFNWEKAGHLHPVRVGRAVFYRSEEVDRLAGLPAARCSTTENRS